MTATIQGSTLTCPYARLVAALGDPNWPLDWGRAHWRMGLVDDNRGGYLGIVEINDHSGLGKDLLPAERVTQWRVMLSGFAARDALLERLNAAGE